MKVILNAFLLEIEIKIVYLTENRDRRISTCQKQGRAQAISTKSSNFRSISIELDRSIFPIFAHVPVFFHSFSMLIPTRRSINQSNTILSFSEIRRKPKHLHRNKFALAYFGKYCNETPMKHRRTRSAGASAYQRNDANEQNESFTSREDLLARVFQTQKVPCHKK